MATTPKIGFVGLGNMGFELATNLVSSGFEVVAHDFGGPRRTPAGAGFAEDVKTLAVKCRTIVFSLPDGAAAEAVAGEIAATSNRLASTIVDTSTVGAQASKTIASMLASKEIGYVDAPVSGGAAGARARTLVVMYAANHADCERVSDVLDGLSDRRFRVGDKRVRLRQPRSPTISCRQYVLPRPARPSRSQ